MKKSATISLVFGVFLLILGLFFLVLFAIGFANSNFEDDVNIGENRFYVLGDQSASRITGEYSASVPIDVYITTDERIKTGNISIENLDNLVLLDEENITGMIDYKTPDSSNKYYLIFDNPNDQPTLIVVSVEFQNELLNTIFLLLGLIMLIVGIVLISLGLFIHKKSKSRPRGYPVQTQYPQQYPVQQYQQQQYQSQYPLAQAPPIAQPAQQLPYQAQPAQQQPTYQAQIGQPQPAQQAQPTQPQPAQQQPTYQTQIDQPQPAQQAQPAQPQPAQQPRPTQPQPLQVALPAQPQPAQQPQPTQPQPVQQAQPAQQPQPTQGEIRTYGCPNCGKPFTAQVFGQEFVTNCPFCGAQTTIGHL